LTVHAAILQVLGALTLIALGSAIACFLCLALPRGREWLQTWLHGQVRHPIVWALAVPVVAMTGSLYFSQIVHMIPCELCWYQRIAMYPLVPILAVGAFRGEAGVWRYALPLPLIGILVSAYHVVIQYGPSGVPQPCGTGVSCATRYVSVFGFISIPLMAATAFLLLIALLLLVRHIESGSAEANPDVG
jgi:disulfide bond formation protein DsbB